MRQLILNKKTGFRNVTPTRPVIIRDFRHKIFYSTVGLSPVKMFNLPIGTYFIDQGNIKKMAYPVEFKYSELPTPERKFKSPSNFSIQFGYNPNKCTIKWLEDTILFDNALRDEPLPSIYFILYHEFGHARYKTEKYADLYASNMMIKRGYNPSQIGKAPITSLSEMQYERKKHIVKRLINSR
jgi:hypothetical protein